MFWSNDKIRIYYNIPLIIGVSRGIFSNTAKSIMGKQNLTKEEETLISFRRTADSKMQIFFKFDDELKDCRTI